MEVVYTGSLKKQNKKNEKTLASVFCIVCTGLEISELGFKKTKQGKKRYSVRRLSLTTCLEHVLITNNKAILGWL